ATLVNYAMHAEVLNEANHLLTADYPGVLRETVEQRFGGIALFYAADIGGMQSPFVLFHSFWSCRRVGVAVGQKAIESLEGQPLQDVTDLSVQGAPLLLPVDNPRFLGAIQKGLFGNAAKFVKKADEKVQLSSDLSFIRLGPALFATIPGELFPEL